MGSYNFRWAHPAGEVFVTGTFDDWSKSVRLEKTEGAFEKLVQLPVSDRKIYYKFVVDGNWTTDYGLPCENDGSGNVNNFLTPQDLVGSHSGSTHSDDHMPGAFPETPAVESRNPADSERAFGVTPLPASFGLGNPISLAPGEQVPHHSEYTSNTLQSNVRLDQESYERSDAYPTADDNNAFTNTRGAFGVPPVTNSMIPESSLPMGSDEQDLERDAGPTFQSAGAGTSTSFLAGQVPREPRGVPQVVTDSQQEANMPPEASASPEAVMEKKQMEEEYMQVVPEEQPAADGSRNLSSDEATKPVSSVPQVVADSQYDANTGPEASGNPEAVEGKQNVENELMSKVPEEQPTSESGSSIGRYAAAAVGGVGGAGIVAAAASWMPASIQQAIDNMNTGKNPLATASSPSTADSIPATVTQSFQKAHESGEAASNPEAVAEKSTMERELLQRVPTTEESGEPASSGEAAYSNTATTGTSGVDSIPTAVTHSLEQAHQSGEAITNPEAVAEKSAMEQELLQRVPTTDESGEPAPTETDAFSRSAPTDTSAFSGNVPTETSAFSGNALTDSSAFSRNAPIGTSAFSDNVPTEGSVVSSLPTAVTHSLDQAHESGEAASYPEAVAEKSAMEQELLERVPTNNESGEPAPTQTAVLSDTAPAALSGAGTSTGTGLSNEPEYRTLVDEDTAPAISAMSIGDRGIQSTSNTFDSRDMDSGVSPVSTTSVGQATQSQSIGTLREAPMSVAARVFGAPTENLPIREAAPAIATTTAAAPAVSAVETATPAYAQQERSIDVRDDPVDTYSGSAAAPTSSTSAVDPRSIASTSASDPFSTSEAPAPSTTASIPSAASNTVPSSAKTAGMAATTGASALSTTGTSASTSGLNAPASAPAKSVATEAAAQQTSTTGTVAAAPATSASTSASTAKTGAAPAAAAAAAAAQKPAGGSMAQAIRQTRQDSRDVSPHSAAQAAGGSAAQTVDPNKKTGWQNQAAQTPEKKTAAGMSSAGSTPQSGGSSSGGAAAKEKEEKKRKRQSFFGKLKDKFGSHK